MFFNSNQSKGKEVWAEHYAKRGVFNYGIGGDSTRQIIWRLEKGEIDVLYDSMKMIVLMIGTNNLYNDFNGGTDEEIAKAIEIIIDIMHVRFPKVKVLLLGILPRDPASSTRAQNINKMIAKLNGKGNVSFLDMSPEFQESVGKIKTDLYKADTVHLNKNGYQVWQKTMEPLFSKLLEKN
jgi:lysophospholipase L1-like esterase